MPRVITTDKYASIEVAIIEEQYCGNLSCKVEHRISAPPVRLLMELKPFHDT